MERELALFALARLERAGFEAWLVGGCVRDELMGTAPHDYDITTSATPDEIMAVFAGERLIETGRKHGTITLLQAGVPLEITTFRADSTYSDHRHPDAVTFTRSLHDDLARRDFTMNAIAMDAQGSICDPFGGRDDIQRKRIRTVGDPMQRFTEDALRILRGLRFASMLGFSLEEGTRQAMAECKAQLAYVSAERVGAELGKLICGAHVREVLISHVDILGAVIPELLPMAGFDQRNYHHIYDVLEHTARVVEKTPPEPTLRWAALFHDAGKPESFTMDAAGVGHFYGHADRSRALAARALERLRIDRATQAAVDQLIRYHDSPIACTPRAVRHALGKLTPEGFWALLQLKRADNLAQNPAFWSRQQECDALEALAREILAGDDCFCLRDLAVNGHDLLALGWQPGPEVGRILQALLEDVVADRVPNEREALLREAKKK